MEPSKPRIEYVDLAKGFLIILVVLHHVDQEVFMFKDDTTRCFLSTFRMPLYYVLSGFFISFKSGYRNFIEKKLNRLIVPFCFFVFLTNAYNFVLNRVWSGNFLHTDFVYESPFYYAWTEILMFQNGSLWFLVSLFETYMLYLVLNQVCKGKIEWTLTLSLLLSVIGYYFKMPFFLDTSITCLPFVVVGTMIRRYKLLEYCKSNVIRFGLALVCFGIILLLHPDKFHFYRNDYEHDPIWMVWCCGVLGSVGILLFSSMMNKLPVVSYVGRYSIIVLGTHAIFIPDLLALTQRWMSVNVSILVSSIVVLAISILMISTLKRWVPKCVAQSDLIKFA